MKHINIFIILIVLYSSLNAITWTRVYGGSDDDYAHSIKQTPEGGYIVIGSTKSFGLDYFNIWLLKLDQYGDTLWSKVYDSIYDYTRNIMCDIEVDFDSGYVFVGSIRPDPYTSDLIIIKTDIYGDSVWSRRYNIYQSYPSFYNTPYDLDRTSDSCFVIVGNAMLGNDHGFIFKIDQNGDSIWATIYGEEMHYSSVCETPDKGFFVTANDPQPTIMSLLKFDSLGNYVFYKYLNSTIHRDIEKLEDNNYIIVAYTDLKKIDPSGDTIWTRSFAGLDATPTEDSGCVITGGINGDLYIMKFNKDGDSLWSAVYGKSGAEAGYSIEHTLDDGYIIAGTTSSYGSGGYDYYIIKTDSFGYALGVEEQVINSNPENFNISYISNQNGNVIFNFALPRQDNVKLEIFDLSGRLISIPINDNFSEGEHETNITLPNRGVYIYKFTTSQNEQSGLPTIVTGKFLVF